MSQYYNISGKKLRISDHEPNTALRGDSDIYFWTHDACGTKLSLGSQIDAYCDKHSMSIIDFEKVIRDYADDDEECMYMLMEISNGSNA